MSRCGALTACAGATKSGAGDVRCFRVLFFFHYKLGHCPLCVERGQVFIGRGDGGEEQHASCGKCRSLGGSDAQPPPSLLPYQLDRMRKEVIGASSDILALSSVGLSLCHVEFTS